MSKRDQDEGGFEATTGQSRESANWLLGGTLIGAVILIIGAIIVFPQLF
jgi:hypothetical protein